MLASIAVLAGAAVGSAAKAQPADDACAAAAPSAAICIGPQKPVEAAAATCRTNGGPEAACSASPYGHVVRPSELAAYQRSWLHRAAQLQFTLGDAVPLGDAQWIGTHNSFNTDANGPTLSHTDSNQQLTLTEQLDGDVRSIELDLHYVPGGTGSNVVRVCHGRGPDEKHAGCTTEPLLADVLPEIQRWLTAHPRQVILLYLEDELGDARGYAESVAALDAGLPGRIFRPAPAPAGGCTELPLSLTRDAVLAAGNQVVLVGNCRAGWSADVFGWDKAHTEAGNTRDYGAYPTCNPKDDTSRLVRYFEDSTWLSSAIAPDETPAAHQANALTPARVATMTRCGVNLLGLDQFDPNDGRVAAAIWSWARDELPAAGECTTQGADGRWASGSCRGVHPAACRTADGWALTHTVAAPAAATACRRRGAFDPPRTGLENARLRDLAGERVVWLASA